MNYKVITDSFKNRKSIRIKSLFTALAVVLFMTANVIAQVPSYVPTNGLVGWWPFNGNASDESGNGNNGTVNGATLSSDRFGNANAAYSFNGINQWIEVQDNSSLDLTQELTMSVWIYKPVFEQRYEAVVIKDQDNLSIQGINYKLQINSNNNMDFYSTRGWGDVSFSTNDWHQFVVVNSMDSIFMYYDNNLIYTELNQFSNGQLSNNNLPLTIGRLPYDEYDSPNTAGNERMYLKGKLDDIGIWNRALSPQEVGNLYLSCSNNLKIAPLNIIQIIGGNATLTATTSDSNPIITWQSDLGQGFQTLNNYGNYSGTTSNVLTISNVQLSNYNQPIRAISTSNNCIDTSNISVIQIADTCITNFTIYDTLLTTITDTIIINTMLSLPAPNNQNAILIYPNPASDHITIDNGNFTAMAGYSIKIENNAGQQVFQSAINQQQFYVDLSTWTGNGLYFVHLIDSQNNTVTVRKIVLQ